MAASVAVHAAIVLAIGVRSPETRAPAQEPRSAAVPPSCELDAALLTTARIGMCATPFSGAPVGCARDAAKKLEYELIQCDGTDEARKLAKQDELEVALLDADEIVSPMAPVPPEDQNQAKKRQEEIEKKHEEAKRAERKRRPSGQVVEITEPKNEVRPDDTRYVSEYDSKVEEETVARGSTEKMVEKPGPKHLPESEDPSAREDIRPPDTEPGPQQPQETGDPDADRGDGQGKASALAMRQPEPSAEAPGPKTGSEAPPSEGGAMVRQGEGGKRATKEGTLEPRRENEGGGFGADRKRTSPPNLRPSEELLARATGGGSVDKLDGVKKGETTALNSKRWKYASFFNRLKRQVAQHWHPGRVYRQRDPHGKVYGNKNRVTVLRVSLDRDGSLARVIVAQKSGVGFLDEEAVRAFRAAQPFPNPPGGLSGGSKQITFSFGFHFRIGGSGGQWRIFRHR